MLHDDASSGVRCSSDRVLKAIEATARCFATRHDKAKFASCECLVGVLDFIQGTYEPDSPTLTALHRSNAWTKLTGVFVGVVWVKVYA